MQKTVYRIRRKSDGLFSTGGNRPSFTVKGKVWNNKGGLHAHLNMNPKKWVATAPGPFGEYRSAQRDAYEGCELVEFEIVETEKTTTSLDAYRAAKQKADDAKKDRTRTRITRCPSCNQPLSTHQCSVGVFVGRR